MRSTRLCSVACASATTGFSSVATNISKPVEATTSKQGFMLDSAFRYGRLSQEERRGRAGRPEFAQATWSLPKHGHWLVPLAVLALLQAGCGGGPSPTYPVEGTVKFADGTPLSGG